jgi:hypothetical protein
MGLFSLFSFAKPKPPASPPEIAIPQALPRITRPVGEIMVAAGLILEVEQMPDAVVKTLLQQGKVVDAVHFLAHGLPERDAIRWAVDACEMTGAPPSVAEARVIEICKVWLVQNSVPNQAMAAEAAAKAGHRSPSAWAAQAVAWATSSPRQAVSSQSNGLVSKAAAGAVMLAAAVSKDGFNLQQHLESSGRGSLAGPTVAFTNSEPGASNTEIAQLYRAFVERGLAIAAGAA